MGQKILDLVKRMEDRGKAVGVDIRRGRPTIGLTVRRKRNPAGLPASVSMKETIQEIRKLDDPNVAATPVLLGGGTINAMVRGFVGADNRQSMQWWACSCASRS